MRRYTFRFQGRYVGSIGVAQQFTVTVPGQDEQDALRRLYMTHEHIHQPTVVKIEDGGDRDDLCSICRSWHGPERQHACE